MNKDHVLHFLKCMLSSCSVLVIRNKTGRSLIFCCDGKTSEKFPKKPYAKWTCSLNGSWYSLEKQITFVVTSAYFQRLWLDFEKLPQRVFSELFFSCQSLRDRLWIVGRGWKVCNMSHSLLQGINNVLGPGWNVWNISHNPRGGGGGGF